MKQWREAFCSTTEPDPRESRAELRELKHWNEQLQRDLRRKDRALAATQADSLYSWVITYLPAPLRGASFYPYLFVDVFSRKILGWQVFDCESAELVHWFNGVHRRSSVTPDQCHAGLEQALLSARAQVYEKARQANPLRWSGQVRDWTYVYAVHLSPDTHQNKEPPTIQKTARFTTS